VTDDRQTDHARKKCVGIGGIACVARTIPPNNLRVYVYCDYTLAMPCGSVSSL